MDDTTSQTSTDENANTENSTLVASGITVTISVNDANSDPLITEDGEAVPDEDEDTAIEQTDPTEDIDENKPPEDTTSAQNTALSEVVGNSSAIGGLFGALSNVISRLSGTGVQIQEADMAGSTGDLEDQEGDTGKGQEHDEDKKEAEEDDGQMIDTKKDEDGLEEEKEGTGEDDKAAEADDEKKDDAGSKDAGNKQDGDLNSTQDNNQALTDSMLGVETAKVIRSAIMALASDQSLRDSVVAMASTEVVKDSILALASETATEDDILSISQKASKKSDSGLLPSKVSIQSSSESVPPDPTDEKSDGAIIQNQTDALSIKSVTESERQLSPPNQPSKQSWVGGTLESPPTIQGNATFSAVENLQLDKSPTKSLQDLEEFAQLLEESTRHKSVAEPFDPLGMAQQETNKPVGGIILVMDDDVSGFLASVKSSSSSSSTSSESEPSIVGSTSTVMVFGAPSKAPEDAPDGNVYNWLRKISAEEVPTQESDKKPGTKKRKPKSTTRKDTEQPSDESIKTRDPCGVCPCCKGMQRMLGICGEETPCSEGTGDASINVPSPAVLEKVQDSSTSDCKDNEVSSDEGMRMQDPKNWLKRATDEFMRRDCIRQVVLHHNMMDGDCKRTKVTRVSRAPTSFTDCLANEANSRESHKQKLQIQINKRDNTIDYMMSVPRPCCESPRRQCNRPKKHGYERDFSKSRVRGCNSLKNRLKSRERSCLSSKKRCSKSPDPCKKKRSKSRSHPCAELSTGDLKKDDLLQRARSSLGCIEKRSGSWLSGDLDGTSRAARSCLKRGKSAKRKNRKSRQRMKSGADCRRQSTRRPRVNQSSTAPAAEIKSKRSNPPARSIGSFREWCKVGNAAFGTK